MNSNVAINNAPNAQCFFSGVVEYKLDDIQHALNDNEISNSSVKRLSFSLIEASKLTIKENTNALLSIARAISAWEENKELAALKESIMCRYADKQDVCRIYLCKENQIASFIVVMDDSTMDSVFEYNEIGFELSEKHQEIEDFMIIDEEEAEGCLGLLSNYNMIYTRG